MAENPSGGLIEARMPVLLYHIAKTFVSMGVLLSFYVDVDQEPRSI